VEPVLRKGESYAMASERVLKLVEDSDIEVTLKIKHPEKVKLT
jgi:hypothetical protein